MKVNGRDITAIVRLQHDQGFDPLDAEFLAPQFGGAPALSEGAAFVAESARNKQWKVPVIASAANPGALDALTDDLNTDLFRGAQVEFRPDGATQSTFFDLEAGRYDWQYENFLHRQSRMRGTLNLWTRPYGHTGTVRVILASQVTTAMLGPANYLLTGLGGDARALGNLYVGRDAAGVVMYGLHPASSFRPFIHAGSMLTLTTASTVAGPNTIASQSLHYGAAANASANLAQFSLPPAAYSGRHRVFAIAGHSYTNPVGTGAVQMYLTSRDGGQGERVSTATSLVTRSASGQFGLVDLGEISVPSQVPGAGAVATQRFDVRVFTSFPTYTASKALRLNGVVLVPLDHSAAIVSAPTQGRIALRSYPQREMYTAEAGTDDGPSMIRQADVLHVTRGEPPRFPQATQARLMVWASDAPTAINPVATATVQMGVIERFQFVR